MFNWQFGNKWPSIPKPYFDTTKDGNGQEFQQVTICDDPDDVLFSFVAATLQQELHGKFVQKVAGLDEVYWDLKVGESIITLHQQHFLGIMLLPGDLSEASEDNKILLKKAFDIIMNKHVTRPN